MFDLRLAERAIYVAPSVRNEAFEAAATAFVNPDSEKHQTMFAPAQKAAEHHRYNRLVVPATQFIVEVALDVLEHEDVAIQTPSEVEDRTQVAYEVVRGITKDGIVKNVFREAYKAAGITGNNGLPSLQDILEPQMLNSFGQAVFADTQGLAGGGLHFLREQAPSLSDPQKVIKQSLGLLGLAARLHSPPLRSVYQQIGKPYVHGKHFKLMDSPDGPRLKFTDETRTYLQSVYVGSGCPAAHIKSPDGGTLLQQSWYRAVDYLIPDFALTKNYRDPPEPSYYER